MTKDPRPLAAVALIALTGLTSTGCGSDSTPQGASTTSTTSSTDDVGTSSTRTITEAVSTATGDNAGKASTGRARPRPARSSQPGTLPPQSRDGRNQPERTLGASAPPPPAPSPSAPPR